MVRCVATLLAQHCILIRIYDLTSIIIWHRSSGTVCSICACHHFPLSVSHTSCCKSGSSSYPRTIFSSEAGNIWKYVDEGLSRRPPSALCPFLPPEAAATEASTYIYSIAILVPVSFLRLYGEILGGIRMSGSKSREENSSNWQTE